LGNIGDSKVDGFHGHRLPIIPVRPRSSFETDIPLKPFAEDHDEQLHNDSNEKVYKDKIGSAPAQPGTNTRRQSEPDSDAAKPDSSNELQAPDSYEDNIAFCTRQNPSAGSCIPVLTEFCSENDDNFWSASHTDPASLVSPYEPPPYRILDDIVQGERKDLDPILSLANSHDIPDIDLTDEGKVYMFRTSR
jgi:hypothetical protein